MLDNRTTHAQTPTESYRYASAHLHDLRWAWVLNDLERPVPLHMSCFIVERSCLECRTEVLLLASSCIHHIAQWQQEANRTRSTDREREREEEDLPVRTPSRSCVAASVPGTPSSSRASAVSSWRSCCGACVPSWTRPSGRWRSARNGSDPLRVNPE